jgi:hypothetical protein
MRIHANWLHCACLPEGQDLPGSLGKQDKLRKVNLKSEELNDPVVYWQRRLGDNQESAGSSPAGIT